VAEPRPHPAWPLACFTALTIAQHSLQLLLLPVYLRYLTPAEYGTLAILTVSAQLVGVAANLKLDSAMRTFYFDHDRDSAASARYLQQVFSASVVVAAGGYVLMLLVADRLFAALFVHDTLRFFPAGAVAFATACAGACLSPYLIHLRNRLALRELIFWQLCLVLGTAVLQVILVVFAGLGLMGVLWGALVPSALTLLAVCVARPGLLTPRLDLAYLAPSIRYALPLVGLGLLYALGTRLDRLVLERYLDLADVGAYALLLALFAVPNAVLDALDNTIRPYLYPLLRSGARPAAAVSFQHAYLGAGLVAVSAAVCLGANLDLLTDDATYLSTRGWLALAATAYVPTVLTRYYALIHDFHKASVGLTLGIVARFAVFFVLLVLLVPRDGFEGALLALLGAECFTACLFWYATGRRFPAAGTARVDLRQLGLFLAAVWYLAYVLGADAPAAFGALQLAAVASALLYLNRGALRAVLARR